MNSVQSVREALERPPWPPDLTKRQSAFLKTVMLNSGVFVGRQYTAFAGITHGQKVHDFVEKLLVRRFVTPIELGSTGRMRIFHVHHKAERFMPGGAAHGAGNQNQREFAATVDIKRLGLNRCAGARLWRFLGYEVV